MARARVETIGLLGDNYAYLVIDEERGEAAAVDPAEPRTVARRAAELGVQIRAIWCTHHHPDHSGGNLELVGLCGECAVVGHEQDAPRIPGITDSVKDGDTLRLGRIEVQVLHTPGHTRGSVCYLVEDALFTGDTLFAAGCGRLFEGDPPLMYHSLQDRLVPLPPATQVYCGHEYAEKNLDFAWGMEPGNPALQHRIEQVSELRRQGRPSVPSTLAEEVETNPFLRCQDSEIIATLVERHGLRDRSPLGVFTALRELRNRF